MNLFCVCRRVLRAAAQLCPMNPTFPPPRHDVIPSRRTRGPHWPPPWQLRPNLLSSVWAGTRTFSRHPTVLKVPRTIENGFFFFPLVNKLHSVVCQKTSSREKRCRLTQRLREATRKRYTLDSLASLELEKRRLHAKHPVGLT